MNPFSLRSNREIQKREYSTRPEEATSEPAKLLFEILLPAYDLGNETQTGFVALRAAYRSSCFKFFAKSAVSTRDFEGPKKKMVPKLIEHVRCPNFQNF